MLFQLVPTSQVLWTDLPAEALGPLIDRGRDLAKLDWREDTDRAFDLTLLALAVRYGWPCTTGIVLGGEYVQQRFQGLDLQRMHDANAPTRALVVQQAEELDRYVPGWSEEARDVHRRAEQVIADALERMDLDLQAMLDDVPIRPDLVRHWSFIGGLPYQEE